MRKQRRGGWSPRRVLDATTRQIMVGNDSLEAATTATPPSSPISPRVPGILSLLYGKESA